MYLQNKYSQWYYNIINRAKSRTLDDCVYSEKHHIIPRSLGGTNATSNIAVLTAREHFICHCLLPKFTTGQNQVKMFHAAWRMCFTKHKNCQEYKITSTTYAFLKTQRANYLKTIKGNKHPNFGKKTGRTSHSFTPEWKANISSARKGSQPWNKGIPVPEDQKRRQSTTRKSKKGTPGFNVRPACRPEKAKAISETQKGRRWVYHPSNNDRRPVSPDEIDAYLNLGWKPGQGIRRKPTTHAHTTGMKWVINQLTKEIKMIQSADLQSYLVQGWSPGRISRN
jgi:hypothetical protein